MVEAVSVLKKVVGVYVRQSWKKPCPNAEEVRLLLDAIPDYSDVKVALGFILVCAMRPSEVVDSDYARWPNLEVDSEGHFAAYNHVVYKPTYTKVRYGWKQWNKGCRKKIWEVSPWFHDQLAHYYDRSVPVENQRLFVFSTAAPIANAFKNIRKRISKRLLPPDYECFLDKLNDTIKGSPDDTYRISAYGLRRFAMSFHYWVTFNQDKIALRDYVQHSSAETTMGYVQSMESIGLTQEMIDRRITMDEFIFGKSPKQLLLMDYDPFAPKPVTAKGQTKLQAFPQDIKQGAPADNWRDCLRCGHHWWKSRPGEPKVCPKCKSFVWFKPLGTIPQNAINGHLSGP